MPEQMTKDVYFLFLHEPYMMRGAPVPINATIVHAQALLHTAVPQPDGGRMYRCLTEFPGRTAGCVVPFSTLTHELDGGRLWNQVADWEAVTEALLRLARDRHCTAMPIGLPEIPEAVLASGPETEIFIPALGKQLERGGPERQEYIDYLSAKARDFAEQEPFFPGRTLTKPPPEPAVMPYKPYRRAAPVVAPPPAQAQGHDRTHGTPDAPYR